MFISSFRSSSDEQTAKRGGVSAGGAADIAKHLDPFLGAIVEGVLPGGAAKTK